MKRVIQWVIDLPMEVPDEWDKDMIEFHFNESSWCCDNLIDELEKFSEEHGCICPICHATVVVDKDLKEVEK